MSDTPRTHGLPEWRWAYDAEGGEYIDSARFPTHPSRGWMDDLGAWAVALLIVPAVGDSRDLPCGRWASHPVRYLNEPPPSPARDVTSLALELLAEAWGASDVLAEAMANEFGS